MEAKDLRELAAILTALATFAGLGLLAGWAAFA